LRVAPAASATATRAAAPCRRRAHRCSKGGVTTT
jgi:hypothetical protein